jgi:uncharacterized protein involved in exopolysaccharide biosynthesis
VTLSFETATDRRHAPPLREPRRPRDPVGPLQALLRHPWLALVIVLACTGAGVASGLQRTPDYSSQARLNVGGIDVDSQALPGYVSAVESLAGSYSRAIDSDAVVRDAARRARLPVASVRRRVTASPVPGSSVIQVDAQAPDAREAQRLADASAAALIAYVRDLGGSDASARTLLRDYREAELRAERAESEREDATTDADRRAAEADYAAARLEARTLGTQYQNAVRNRPAGDFIRVLADAGTAADDRRSQLKLRALTGLIAGLVLAAGLTTLIANRHRLRARA